MVCYRCALLQWSAIIILLPTKVRVRRGERQKGDWLEIAKTKRLRARRQSFTRGPYQE